MPAATMPRYIPRQCPRCHDYFGVVVSQESKSNGEHPITAYCGQRSYQLKDWRLIVGRKRPVNAYLGRMPKVFS